jgi:hypothetical protein
MGKRRGKEKDLTEDGGRIGGGERERERGKRKIRRG